ncbi:hypothetical protein LSAT2_032975, partial [Lamellibrachia satsuma]
MAALPQHRLYITRSQLVFVLGVVQDVAPCTSCHMKLRHWLQGSSGPLINLDNHEYVNVVYPLDDGKGLQCNRHPLRDANHQKTTSEVGWCFIVSDRGASQH